MKRVILESPYAGASPWRLVAFFQRWRNRRYARACVRHSLSLGEAPIASHLLYTQPGILDDADPVERQWGIAAGLEWGAAAEATVVYIDRGLSRGMALGIASATGAGRPVEQRRLYHPPSAWERRLAEVGAVALDPGWKVEPLPPYAHGKSRGEQGGAPC